jgi:hypothetical protein
VNDSKPQHKRFKETVTKPSGLIKDWETKGISRSSWEGRGARNDPTLATQSTVLENVIGGLADEDLDSQRPPSKGLKGRDAMRTNEASTLSFKNNQTIFLFPQIVHIASDSEAELSKKAAIRQGKQRKALKSTETLKSTKAQKPQLQETHKFEPSFDSELDTSSKALVKGESVEKPLFVMADWTTRFLPTLYHFLFCSEKPFHEFSRGSGFTTVVQKVLSLVHPGNTYIVTTACKIYKTVSIFSFARFTL